jgi:hypothetical protein
MTSTYTPKPNQGAIFPDKKRENPDAPTLRGDLYLDRKLIEDLLAESGELVKISIASWEKISKANTVYYTLAASKPFKKEQA